jgi:hypothetical protein
MKKSRMQSKVKSKSKNGDTTITAMAAKSNGLDTSDNILVKTEYSDLVQELSDGDFTDDSFTATYTHDPDTTKFN